MAFSKYIDFRLNAKQFQRNNNIAKDYDLTIIQRKQDCKFENENL